MCGKILTPTFQTFLFVVEFFQGSGTPEQSLDIAWVHLDGLRTVLHHFGPFRLQAQTVKSIQQNTLEPFYLITAGTYKLETNLLLVGCSSVLVEGGQVTLLFFRAQADGLRVALDGLLVLTRLEILVASVLGSLCLIQRALQTESKENVSNNEY